MALPTVIIGASPNQERYSFIATQRLKQFGHPVYPLGIKSGKIGETAIITDRPVLTDIDTVTLYIGPANQPLWMDYILKLKPKRLIFNPGTENQEFIAIAEEQGIECLEACTLVLLSTGQY